MSEIHFEAPPRDDNTQILAWSAWTFVWESTDKDTANQQWKDNYVAWMEMPPAPVKPRRFVVGEYVASGVTYWRVTDTVDYFYPAYLIPTPEAAQRIADIYEETTP